MYYKKEAFGLNACGTLYNKRTLLSVLHVNLSYMANNLLYKTNNMLVYVCLNTYIWGLENDTI